MEDSALGSPHGFGLLDDRKSTLENRSCRVFASAIPLSRSLLLDLDAGPIFLLLRWLTTSGTHTRSRHKLPRARILYPDRRNFPRRARERNAGGWDRSSARRNRARPITRPLRPGNIVGRTDRVAVLYTTLEHHPNPGICHSDQREESALEVQALGWSGASQLAPGNLLRKRYSAEARL